MKYSICSFLILCCAISACAQDSDRTKENDIPITLSDAYGYELVVPDLEIPWGMDFMPDGSFLVTEKVAILSITRMVQKP
jgi:glucose/arabinose dehydrogenase